MGHLNAIHSLECKRIPTFHKHHTFHRLIFEMFNEMFILDLKHPNVLNNIPQAITEMRMQMLFGFEFPRQSNEILYKTLCDIAIACEVARLKYLALMRIHSKVTIYQFICPQWVGFIFKIPIRRLCTSPIKMKSFAWNLITPKKIKPKSVTFYVIPKRPLVTNNILKIGYGWDIEVKLRIWTECSTKTIDRSINS